MAQQQETEPQQDTQHKQLQVNELEHLPQPIYPNPPHFEWPTSKPGPRSTPPPPGMSSMPGRTEQTVEIGYNQETGTPSTENPLRYLPDAEAHGQTSFDEPRVQPNATKKRRK